MRNFRAIVFIATGVLLSFVLSVVAFDPAEADVTDTDIHQLIQELVSEDAKVAREARTRLEALHEPVVPALFKKLVEADWDLKPALLEVLTEHGRDYARLKLLHGTGAEKTHAALLYELIDQGEDTESREYAAMVEVLLKSLEGEDKKLRAAALVGLIEPLKDLAFSYEHFYQFVPALISSFDTDLVIFRGHRDNPFDATFTSICTYLDVLVGDRLAYLDIRSALWNNADLRGVDHDLPHSAYMAGFLAANRDEIDELRTYWQSWWDGHAKMSVVEIGKVMIERNLRLLPEAEPTYEELEKWTRAKRKEYLGSRDRHLIAKASLQAWTGQRSLSANEWRAWWTTHRATYKGPVVEDK